MRFDIWSLYLAALILGAGGALLVSRLGKRFSLLDVANHRSSHEGVVPKGGGIGILAAFIFSALVLNFPAVFWLSIGFVALLSFYGDRNELKPEIRLWVQFVAGIGLLLALFYWEGRGWSAYMLIPVFSVFVVGTANYYNFMDGIDGIAGITGIVAFGLIVLFGVFSRVNEPLLVLSGCMGFACLGFLPFNMPKARVFMGDVGSVLLGFVYAGLVVGLAHSLNDFVVLCSFLFPFYADELMTEYVRIKDGGWTAEGRGVKCRVVGPMGILMTPHRWHVYQLLANEMGIDHWKVSAGYGVLQLIVGVGAFALREYGTLAVVGFLGVWFAGFWGFGCWVRKRTELFRGPGGVMARGHKDV